MNKLQKVNHTLDPVYDCDSLILILGTMPSVKSKEVGFYYSHPQNRFWKVISTLLNEKLPSDNESKRTMLLTHHIALWDVLSSCLIKGSDDNSISNITVNDFSKLINNSKITKIYTTGKKATSLYQKYCFPVTKIPSIYLPSTSPANCRNMDLDKLIEAYSIILNDLD